MQAARRDTTTPPYALVPNASCSEHTPPSQFSDVRRESRNADKGDARNAAGRQQLAARHTRSLRGAISGKQVANKAIATFLVSVHYR